MKSKRGSRSIRSAAVLLFEIAAYAVLVTGYLVIVLRSLSPFLLDAAEHHRALFATLSLLLMLGQGIFLELLTTLLVGFFVRARRDEGLSTSGFKD